MNLAKLPTTIAIAAGVTCAVAPSASADPEGGQRYGGSRHGADSFVETTPNAELIASGFFTLAIPYMASVVAATESTRRGDNFLYTPVAGPWLDLSNRDNCPPTGTCANEAAYKILLVADGVLQGFGALEIVSGFLFPVVRSVNTDSSPHVRIAPSVAHNSAGVTAFGTF